MTVLHQYQTWHTIHSVTGLHEINNRFRWNICAVLASTSIWSRHLLDALWLAPCHTKDTTFENKKLLECLHMIWRNFKQMPSLMVASSDYLWLRCGYWCLSSSSRFDYNEDETVPRVWWTVLEIWLPSSGWDSECNIRWGQKLACHFATFPWMFLRLYILSSVRVLQRYLPFD